MLYTHVTFERPVLLGKITLIRRAAVRETGLFRHQGGQFQGPLKVPYITELSYVGA